MAKKIAGPLRRAMDPAACENDEGPPPARSKTLRATLVTRVEGVGSGQAAEVPKIPKPRGRAPAGMQWNAVDGAWEDYFDGRRITSMQRRAAAGGRSAAQREIKPPAAYDPTKEAARAQWTPASAAKKSPARKDTPPASPAAAAWPAASAGTLVDALDTKEIWAKAKILAVDGQMVQVSFVGFNSKFDEWVERNSERLAERGSHTAEVTVSLSLFLRFLSFLSHFLSDLSEMSLISSLTLLSFSLIFSRILLTFSLGLSHRSRFAEGGSHRRREQPAAPPDLAPAALRRAATPPPSPLRVVRVRVVRNARRRARTPVSMMSWGWMRMKRRAWL